MIYAYILIFGTIGLLSVSVVAMFTWAIRTGQFQDFQTGATSIFDDHEPMGQMTDAFPVQRSGDPPPPAGISDVRRTPGTGEDHGQRV